MQVSPPDGTLPGLVHTQLSAILATSVEQARIWAIPQACRHFGEYRLTRQNLVIPGPVPYSKTSWGVDQWIAQFGPEMRAGCSFTPRWQVIWPPPSLSRLNMTGGRDPLRQMAKLLIIPPVVTRQEFRRGRFTLAAAAWLPYHTKCL